MIGVDLTGPMVVIALFIVLAFSLSWVDRWGARRAEERTRALLARQHVDVSSDDDAR